MKKILASILTPLLGVGLMAVLSAGPALASDNASAGLHGGVSQCNGSGAHQGTDAGFVNVHQADATTVSINYHLRGMPDETYAVWLYTGFCNFDTFLGDVTTNDNGVANALYDGVKIPAGASQLWTYSYDFTPFNQTVESEAVQLG